MNDIMSRYGWPLTPSQRRFAVAHMGGEQQAALICLQNCAVWEDCRCAPSDCPHWPVGIRCQDGAYVFPNPAAENVENPVPPAPRAVPVDDLDAGLPAVLAALLALLLVAAVNVWLVVQLWRLAGG